MTRVADTHVPDDVYETARAVFSERELVDLTMAAIAINGWDRLLGGVPCAASSGAVSDAALTPSAAGRQHPGR